MPLPYHITHRNSTGNCIMLCSVFVFLSLSAGCNTLENYYIEPEYRNQKLSTSVLVLPIQKSWFPDNYSHIFGSLSESERSAFYSSLKFLLTEHLYSRLEVVGPEQMYPDTLFRPMNLTTGEQQFEVLIPRNQVQIESEGFDPRMLLILDRYYFSERQEQTGGSTYAGHEGKLKNYLYFETDYVYWDSSQNRALAWGHINTSIPISEGQRIRYSNYLDLLSKAAELLTSRGPVH